MDPVKALADLLHGKYPNQNTEIETYIENRLEAGDTFNPFEAATDEDDGAIAAYESWRDGMYRKYGRP